MAAVRLLRTVHSNTIFQARRNLATSVVLSNKAKEIKDPVQKLFLDKLNEYKTKSKSGQIAMTPEVELQYKEETERLKRLYGADKEDLSKFPSFKFDKQ